MKKENPKTKPKKRKNNREYTYVMVLFSALFLCMTGYLVHFQWKESRTVINNSYNARLETFENSVIRGSILSRDGDVLAYTEAGADGSEKRIYPYGCTFSHVLGYSEYGKTGIEELANFQLLRSNAYFIERFLNEMREQKNVGDRVVTTLDVRLQTAAHDALGTQKGAAVVLDVQTGDVLAMVSKPDYDPGEVKASWGTLSTSDDGVLLNRATQGLYPPGSIFKTVTLLEYLQENPSGERTFSFTCDGQVSVGNSSIRCYHGKKHGELTLEGAYAASCNSAFAEIGRELDADSFRGTAERLLFNQELPLALPYSKSSFALQEADTEAIRMMTAIGQGDTLVTPVHMAMVTAAAANGGVLMMPRFLLRTENYTGSLVETYSTSVYGTLMSEEEAALVQRYMRAVVEDGTAKALQSDQYTACGKTGTAEYSSNKSKSHAWFTGYVTGEKPAIAVCVLVEGAGSGSEYAVPVAKRIFDAYYAE